MNEKSSQFVTENMKRKSWTEVLSFQEKKKLYLIDEDLDISEVSIALLEDHHTLIEKWIKNGLMSPPTKEEVRIFEKLDNLIFTTCEIEPFIIIQRSQKK